MAQACQEPWLGFVARCCVPGQGMGRGEAWGLVVGAGIGHDLMIWGAWCVAWRLVGLGKRLQRREEQA